MTETKTTDKEYIWELALIGGTTNNKTIKQARTRKITTYKYPELLECVDYIQDEFWKERLKNAAAGKYPPYFKYYDGILKHTKNKTSVRLSSNPEEKLKEFINFMRDVGHIYSPNDIIENNNILKHEINSLSKETWKNISLSKTRRSYYIKDYINKKYAHLDKNIKDELIIHINNCFELQIFKQKNVIFEDNEIKNIVGIDADKNGIIYTQKLTFPNTKINLKKKKKNKIYAHYENWVKYLKDYQKGICSLRTDIHFLYTASNDEAEYSAEYSDSETESMTND